MFTWFKFGDVSWALFASNFHFIYPCHSNCFIAPRGNFAEASVNIACLQRPCWTVYKDHVRQYCSVAVHHFYRDFMKLELKNFVL